MANNTQTRAPQRIGTPAMDLELDWLEACLQFRMDPDASIPPPPPTHSPGDDRYADFLLHNHLGWVERIVIAVALACEMRPAILMDMLKATNKGGYHGIQYSEPTREFVPTLHTLSFLLGELPDRAMAIFLDPGSPLLGKVLDIHRVPGQLTALSTRFSLAPEFLHNLIFGRPYVPGHFFSFPARAIRTEMEWHDLVISTEVASQIDQIDRWLKFGTELEKHWKRKPQFKSGFRVMFHGPPGTGKTLTASLLGKANKREVYRVDLSQVVSKYIGETEKQLKKVFDKAEGRNWILFFDEADALFGKRGKVSDARDRYANQGVSYLLQRVEDFNGLVILATNLKDNLDEAFMRRFQCIVRFTKPNPAERLRLWQNALPDSIPLARNVKLQAIAKQYELTGAAIVNVVQQISLYALSLPEPIISLETLIEGIRIEFAKDNRLI